MKTAHICICDARCCMKSQFSYLEQSGQNVCTLQKKKKKNKKKKKK